jgi:hypothetical protein
MKVPDRMPIPNENASHNMYCVKLQKSLYGLKQSGRMWYNQLSEYLIRKDTLTMMISHVSSSKDPKRDFALYLCMLMI